jgi:hypothetical protein
VVDLQSMVLAIKDDLECPYSNSYSCAGFTTAKGNFDRIVGFWGVHAPHVCTPQII